MFRTRNLLRAALLASVLGPAQALGYPTESKTEVVTQVRRSRAKTKQQSIYGQVFPRSRKTTTAAQLKRASLRRRNIRRKSSNK